MGSGFLILCVVVILACFAVDATVISGFDRGSLLHQHNNARRGAGVALANWDDRLAKVRQNSIEIIKKLVV